VAGVALWQPDTSQPDAPAFESTVKNGLTAQPPDRRDAYMPPLGTQLTDQQILEIARWMCTQSYASVPGFCSQLPQ
jgi:mono/diheme cytochrome c family protein